jgi:uncharacterized membrane protein YeaQ/YmgE (transglycosylase-associated protein family)
LAALGRWGTGMGTRPANTKCAEARVVPACDVEGRPIQFGGDNPFPVSELLSELLCLWRLEHPASIGGASHERSTSRLDCSDHYLVMNIVLGIIGAAVASAIFSFLGINLGGWLGYLIAGFIGACLLIWIVRAVRGTRTV